MFVCNEVIYSFIHRGGVRRRPTLITGVRGRGGRSASELDDLMVGVLCRDIRRHTSLYQLVVSLEHWRYMVVRRNCRQRAVYRVLRASGGELDSAGPSYAGVSRDRRERGHPNSNGKLLCPDCRSPGRSQRDGVNIPYDV